MHPETRAQNLTSQISYAYAAGMPNRRVHHGLYNIHFKDLPVWQQDSQYILTGYRQSTASYTDAICSLGHVHIQTCNICTDLLAIPLLYFRTAMFLRSGAFPKEYED